MKNAVQILRLFLSKRMLVIFFMGFSSGLPILLVSGTLKFWLRKEGMDLTTLGFLGWTTLFYSAKPLWAYFLDWILPPVLGRRRGWLLLWQFGLLVSLGAVFFTMPTENLLPIVLLMVITGFFSASQDIVVDAYRREILPDHEQGVGAQMTTMGYRMGLLLAGAGAIGLSTFLTWQSVYLIMGTSMLIGIVTTLWAEEPLMVGQPTTLQKAIWDPLVEFFHRPGAKVTLAFVLFYKFGDQMAAEMLMPFYVDAGFSNAQIAGVTKVFGLWAVIVGGLLGGVWMLKVGITRALWLFGFLQMISTAGFSLLALIPPNTWYLGAVVAFENISQGMGSAAFVAYMATLCNRHYTATQYALLTALMTVPRGFLGGFSGLLVTHTGWISYFFVCTFLAIPGLILLRPLLAEGQAERS